MNEPTQQPSNCQKLLADVEALAEILRNPEIGCHTWHKHYEEALDRVAEWSPHYRKPK